MEKKVAIITGGSRGIGASIAKSLAIDGFNVVINFVSNENAAYLVLDECNKISSDNMIYKADVSNFSECENMVNAVLEKYGRIDVLVNNAGITKDMLMLKMTALDFTEVIDKNLVSAFNMTKCVTKQMFKQRTGSIINITSVAGVSGNIGQANYSASKAGLIGLTKSLSKEFGARNITVNAVAPGFIKTDMTKELPEKYIEQVTNQTSLKRLGEDTDISNIVSFLASDKAKYITGQIINVDGGLVL
jgi:3-oxoacyl-[acyl-carrier protein] reductase